VLKRLGVEPTEAASGPAGRVEPDASREQDAKRNRGARDIPVQMNPAGTNSSGAVPTDPNDALPKKIG